MHEVVFTISSLFNIYKALLMFIKIAFDPLGRWIEDALRESGVEMTQLKPHSTRHIVTSAAHRNGVNIELIRATAGSPNLQSFAKFYFTPIAEAGVFARAIFERWNAVTNVCKPAVLSQTTLYCCVITGNTCCDLQVKAVA